MLSWSLEPPQKGEPESKGRLSIFQISTTSYRPFRLSYPPADGSTKLNEALASIDAFFEQEDLADIAELSEIQARLKPKLKAFHIALLQS